MLSSQALKSRLLWLVSGFGNGWLVRRQRRRSLKPLWRSPPTCCRGACVDFAISLLAGVLSSRILFASCPGRWLRYDSYSSWDLTLTIRGRILAARTGMRWHLDRCSLCWRRRSTKAGQAQGFASVRPAPTGGPVTADSLDENMLWLHSFIGGN